MKYALLKICCSGVSAFQWIHQPEAASQKIENNNLSKATEYFTRNRKMKTELSGTTCMSSKRDKQFTDQNTSPKHAYKVI
jgi:hypothetical protein